MGRVFQLRFVLFVVLLAVILVVGVAAGIYTGKAVAGSTQAPASQEMTSLRNLGSESPLQTRLEAKEEASINDPVTWDETTTFSGAGRQTTTSTDTVEGSGQLSLQNGTSNQDSLTSTSGTTVFIRSGQTSEGPSLGPEEDIGGAFVGPDPSQASQVLSSGVDVRLVPFGDVDLNGIVDSVDLTHVLRALGTSIKDVDRDKLETRTDGPILLLDWNGDGFVDIVDLATVAFHQGEEL